MMTATIITLMSALSVLAMLIWATREIKELPYCLSDCYYILGIPFTIVFCFASWMILYPAMQCWASPVTFFMVVAFSLVGIACDYKSEWFYNIHYIAALTSGLLSILFVQKVCHEASWCYIIAVIGLLDKRRWLLWVEIGCLLSVFVAVLSALPS